MSHSTRQSNVTVIEMLQTLMTRNNTPLLYTNKHIVIMSLKFMCRFYFIVSVFDPAIVKTVNYRDKRYRIRPRLVERPEDATVSMGDDVVLRCRSDVATDYSRMQWIFATKVIAWNGKPMLYNANFSNFWLDLSGDVGRKYHLHLESVDLRNDGTYQCKATEDLGSAVVRVRSSPSQPTIRLRVPDQIVEPGALVAFRCSSSAGNPLPSYKWLIEGRPLRNSHKYRLYSTIAPHITGDESSSKLKIAIDSKDDGQLLSCMVQNAAIGNHPLISTKKIVFSFAPRVSMSSINVQPGQNLKLTCHVEAQPPGMIKAWYKNGVPLRTSTSVIKRLRANMNDSGTYICIGINRLGSANATARVTVGFSPTISNRNLYVVVGVCAIGVVIVISLLSWLAISTSHTDIRHLSLATNAAKFSANTSSVSINCGRRPSYKNESRGFDGRSPKTSRNDWADYPPSRSQTSRNYRR